MSTSSVVHTDRYVPRIAYPLKVAYDAKALIEADYGTGKGAQLRTLLGTVGHLFTGLAPSGPSNTSLPLIQRGTPRYLVWQQTSLPRLLAEIKPDIFLAPYNTAPLIIPKKTKLLAVVHDLILLESVTGASVNRRLRDAYRGMLLRQAIRRASLILTVSKYTADQVKLRYPESNLRVIHCTVGPSWFIRDRVVPSQQRARYILIVTGNVAHKNVPRALRAFARYKALDPRSNIMLRMAGVSSSSAFFESMADDLGIRDSLIVEPFLSEMELQSLYRHALCVLVPSLMEGFGIPVLEAMASGTPLVSSNAWSLPEVGGNVPLYFDPTNVEEMAQRLFDVCANAALRARLSMDGIERAEMFHPDRIQVEVEAFWRELPALYARF